MCDEIKKIKYLLGKEFFLLILCHMCGVMQLIVMLVIENSANSMKNCNVGYSDLNALYSLDN